MRPSDLKQLFEQAQKSTPFKRGDRVRLRNHYDAAFVVIGFALIMLGPMECRLKLAVKEGLNLKDAKRWRNEAIIDVDEAEVDDRPDALFELDGSVKPIATAIAKVASKGGAS